jgi:hypothetical protein
VPSKAVAVAATCPRVARRCVSGDARLPAVPLRSRHCLAYFDARPLQWQAEAHPPDASPVTRVRASTSACSTNATLRLRPWSTVLEVPSPNVRRTQTRQVMWLTTRLLWVPDDHGCSSFYLLPILTIQTSMLGSGRSGHIGIALEVGVCDALDRATRRITFAPGRPFAPPPRRMTNSRWRQHPRADRSLADLKRGSCGHRSGRDNNSSDQECGVCRRGAALRMAEAARIHGCRTSGYVI